MARSLKVIAYALHISAWSGVFSDYLSDFDSNIEFVPVSYQYDGFDKFRNEIEKAKSANAKIVAMIQRFHLNFPLNGVAKDLDKYAAELVDDEISVARVQNISVVRAYGEYSRDWIGEYHVYEGNWRKKAEEIAKAFAKIK